MIIITYFKVIIIVIMFIIKKCLTINSLIFNFDFKDFPDRKVKKNLKVFKFIEKLPINLFNLFNFMCFVVCYLIIMLNIAIAINCFPNISY